MIVVCGDSFIAGHGLKTREELFANVLAKQLNLPLINLAKSGASNFVTCLQAEYAIKHLNPTILIISSTYSDRFDFLVDSDFNDEITLAQCSYNCPPFIDYGMHIDEYGNKLYLKDNDCFVSKLPKYDPLLITDSIGSLADFLSNYDFYSKTYYYDQYKKIDKKTLQLILNYHVMVGNVSLQRKKDINSFISVYHHAKQKNIRTIILSGEEGLHQVIPSEDIINIRWGDYSLEYPDEYNTLHCNKEAHKLIADIILKKI